MEIEIELNGKKEKVIFKEDINFKQNNELMRQVYSTTINEMTGEMTSKLDKALWNELRLIYYIESAPFTLDSKGVGNLPTKTAMFLLSKIDEITQNNLLTEQDSKKSQGHVKKQTTST